MTDAPDASPGRQVQVNVRMSDTTREHLATLKRFYGVTNTTSLLAFVLAEAVRHLPPPQPFTLPSPQLEDMDGDELAARRTAQQFARGDFPR